MKTTERNKAQDIKDQEKVVQAIQGEIGKVQAEVTKINDVIKDAEALIEVKKKERIDKLHEINELEDDRKEAMEYLLYLQAGETSEDEEE